MANPQRTDSAPGSTSALRTANQQRVLDLLRGGHRLGDDDEAKPTQHARQARQAKRGKRGKQDSKRETEDAFTQAELARMTGLAPATVSNIVRDLSAAGLVDAEAGSGRRGSAVRLSRDAGVVVGVDFGHSHVAVAVGDLTGRVLAEERMALAVHTDHAKALELASGLLDVLDVDRAQVRQVGLGVPAPVSEDVTWSPTIFPGWEGIDVRKTAEHWLRAPVDVENDANLGALAEHRSGNARGYRSSIFVKLSSGVGSGIIIDDRLLRGCNGAAGEIGHLTLDDQGPLCRCGSRGCLEAYASAKTIVDMMADQLPGASLDEVVVAAQEGNVSALRALEDAGLHLGWALASVANLLNPDILVVGGDLARAGDLLLDSARSGLRRHALDSVALTPVVGSEVGERASLVGAVLLAAEQTELLLE